MDTLLQDILTRLGITGGVGTIVAFVLRQIFTHAADKIKAEQNELTELRKQERDSQIKALSCRIDHMESSLARHISHQIDWEKSLCGKIDKLYDRLNPLCDAVNRIQGFLEAKHDKGP
jgi:hypothetical protein